jgi:receptor protein-tyrosine kinase
MSRIHDALKKAGETQPPPSPGRPPARRPPPVIQSQSDPVINAELPEIEPPQMSTGVASAAVATAVVEDELENLEEIVLNARTVPYTPHNDALLVNPSKPREAPAEEFRSLRTRLNHLQTVQPLHTLVVTSASPAEGKSFTAANLAITQAQIADKRILLADFDFRRPNVDKTFQIDCAPGITDYLQGKASLSEILRHIEKTNLWILTAGDAVTNPLELLNLKECRTLLDGLRAHFDWVVLDSPPLLFAADANLLSTMADGTILVVRIGSTTFDSVSRAVQSLCENNILGIVVNGARRGELYSKYTYYHDYYYDREKQSAEKHEPEPEPDAEEE